jgi:uncharacterized protein with HEPN domain
MYSEKNLVYIFIILECIEKCWIYTKYYDNPNDFIWENEQKDFNATISMFIAIGEESKKIDLNLKENILTKINWKAVSGIRDKISHDYRGIDKELLWNTIHKELDKLKNALIEMVILIQPEKELIKEFLKSPYYKHLQYLKDVL